MDIFTGFLLLIIGLVSGGYGIIVGAGGGFIFVPFLLLFLETPPPIAAGTGLVIVLINAFSGAIGYIRQKRIDYKTGVYIAIGALPGTFLGTWLLHMYSSKYFFITFAIILILLGVFLFYKNTPISLFTERKSQKNNNYKEAEMKSNAENLKTNWVIWMIFLGSIMGVFSSYLGIGGGWLLVPILIYIFKIPVHYATATSIFSLLIYSTYGVLIQISYNSIDWEAVWWGSVGIIIGSQLGVKISSKVSGKFIMQMLSILLIIIGIQMYIN